MRSTKQAMCALMHSQVLPKPEHSAGKEHTEKEALQKDVAARACPLSVVSQVCVAESSLLSGVVLDIRAMVNRIERVAAR